MTSTPDFEITTISDANFDLKELARNDIPMLVQLKSKALSLYNDLTKLGFSFFDTEQARDGSGLEIRLYKCPFVVGIPQVGDSINVAIAKCIENGRIPVIMQLCNHYYKYDDSVKNIFAKLENFKYTELRFAGNDFLSSATNCNNDAIDFKQDRKECLDELELHKKLVRLPIPVAVIDTCFMGYLPVVHFENNNRGRTIVNREQQTLSLEPLKISVSSPTVGGVETYRLFV